MSDDDSDDSDDSYDSSRQQPPPPPEIQPQQPPQPPKKLPDDLIEEAIRNDDLRRLKALVKEHPNAIAEMAEDASRRGGSTPMHEATRHGASLEVVQLIARNLFEDMFSYEIEEEYDYHETPLHVAGRNTGLDVIRYLDKTYPEMMGRLDIDGEMCIHRAVKRGLPLNVIKYYYKRLSPLDRYREDYGPPGLLLSVRARTPVDVVQFLAANRELTGSWEGGALEPLHTVLKKGLGLEVVRIVHDRNPDAVFEKGRPGSGLPLHYAASRSKPDVVKFLLTKSTEAARRKDFDGNLPLHRAVSADKRRAVSPLIVRLLVRAWPPAIHEKGAKGQTPLQLAQARGVRNEALLDVLANGLPK